jgi:tetratricopeptide (TPR) repeat protein
MWMNRQLNAALAFAAFIWCPAVVADDSKSWEGQWAVITTRSGIPLISKKGLQKVVFVPYVFVWRADGDRLYIQHENHESTEGWINRNQAVLVPDADEVFSRRLAADPRDADSYYRRAVARGLRKDYDAALKDFADAIRINPDEPAYFIARGGLWNSRGEYDRAVADLDEAIRLAPKSAENYHWRGVTRHVQKKLDDAIADYTKAIDLDPDAIMTYHWRAKAWEAKGDLDRAIGSYDAAIDRFPKVPIPLVERAGLLLRKMDYGRALSDSDAAIALLPNNATAHSSRGIALYKLKKYAAAIAAWDETVRLDPKNWVAINNRAWIRATCPDETLRDGKRALEEAKTACDMTEWKQPLCLGTVAAAHAELGQWAEAVRWQEKAIALADKDSLEEFRACLELYRKGRPKRD